MRTSILLRISSAFVAVLMLVSLVISTLFFTQPAKAGVVAGYAEYYIPGDAVQLFGILTNNDNNISGTNLHNVITIAVSSDNATIYYDHWENGYGNTTTGNDEVYTANKGAVLTFTSDVRATAQHSGMTACTGSTFPAAGTSGVVTASGGLATHCYDGRDRIYIVGGAVSVAQAFWPTSSGPVYANAWEIYPVKPYETHYTIPVGENLYHYGNNATNYPDFQNAYVLVEATADNTTVTIINPGGSSQTTILSRGAVIQMYGINSGTTVDANNPVQVQFIVGRQNANFDSRSHTAVPSDLWDTKYYSPVPSYGTTNVNLYIYNPTAAALSVIYQDSSVTDTISVPANSTRSTRDLIGQYVAAGSAVSLAAADGTTKFWAIGEYNTGSADRNWGFSLIPANTLTSEYFVSWAPGTSDANPSANGSPVYVTPTQDNTTIYVDYSPTDGVVNTTYTLNRLAVQKILDPDNVNTGMHVWSSKPFAIVWGEDAQYAQTGNPYIDAGYTILPLNSVGMDVVLSSQKTASPTSIPATNSQAVTFTITTTADDLGLDSVDVSDILPNGWTYKSGTTNITLPDNTVIHDAPTGTSTLHGRMWATA